MYFYAMNNSQEEQVMNQDQSIEHRTGDHLKSSHSIEAFDALSFQFERDHRGDFTDPIEVLVQVGALKSASDLPDNIVDSGFFKTAYGHQFLEALVEGKADVYLEQSLIVRTSVIDYLMSCQDVVAARVRNFNLSQIKYDHPVSDTDLENAITDEIHSAIKRDNRFESLRRMVDDGPLVDRIMEPFSRVDDIPAGMTCSRPSLLLEVSHGSRYPPSIPDPSFYYEW